MSDWELKIDIKRPDVKGAEAALKKLFKELDRIDKAAKRVDRELEEALDPKKPTRPLSFKDLVGADFVASIGKRGAAAAVQALTTAVGLYTDAARRAVTDSAAFENAIVSIARISGSTEKSIAAMSNEFRLLSTDVPVSVKEFQKFAETASRFGIKGSEGIKQFAQTFGRLQSIIGPVSEETTKSVARIASITNFPIEEIDKFANSVIVLGKNFATSEEQIIRTAERIAQDTSQFGASAEEVLGLATALDALGIKSEKGGSALLRVLDAIQSKAIESGADFARLAELSGLTSKSFEDLSLSSPVKAFERLVASGASGSEIMDRLGLAGVRVQSVLAALTAKSDTFAKAMANANNEIKNNNVLLGDAARQAETNENKIIRLGNAFESAFIGIGTSASDQTGELLDRILVMTDAFIGLDKAAVKTFPAIASLGETAKSLFADGVKAVDSITDTFERSIPTIEKWAETFRLGIKGATNAAKFAAGIIEFFTPDLGEFTDLFSKVESITAKQQAKLDSNTQKGSIFDDSFFTTFKDIAGTFKETVNIVKSDIQANERAMNAAIAQTQKTIESQRSPIDALEKRADKVSFESDLKERGLDDIAKRQARLLDSFLQSQEKLTSRRDIDKSLGLDTTEIDSVIQKLGDNFLELNNALEVSGLIDDIKRFEDQLEKLTKSEAKLDDRSSQLNKKLPQARAITDIVSIGAFISDARDADRRDAVEREKIDLARKSLEVQRENLNINILEAQRAKSKIVRIGGL